MKIKLAILFAITGISISSLVFAQTAMKADDAMKAADTNSASYNDSDETNLEDAPTDVAPSDAMKADVETNTQADANAQMGTNSQAPSAY